MKLIDIINSKNYKELKLHNNVSDSDIVYKILKSILLSKNQKEENWFKKKLILQLMEEGVSKERAETALKKFEKEELKSLKQHFLVDNKYFNGKYIEGNIRFSMLILADFI